MRTLELPTAAIDAFTRTFTGAVVRPADDAYGTARAVWNAMIDRYPALVVRPRHAADIAAAIALAREHSLPLAVRGGGHNVAGTGVCDTGIVIDLADLDTVTVDPEAATITAGGGCTWGQVDAAAARYGLATTGGQISTTGVGGLTLGGGIGWLMRRHGLACDNLLSVTLVTADGRTVVADDTSNRDLFWAVRGGGGNFGVATAFTFRAYPVDVILGGLLLYRGNRTAEALSAYADWASTVGEDMTTMVSLLTAPPEQFVPAAMRGRPALAVLLCHSGDHPAGARVVDRLRTICPPDADLVAPMPYLQLQRMLDGSAPAGRRGYWKSGYIAALDTDLRTGLIEAATSVPSAFSQIHIQQLGAAVATNSAGAVGHRDAAFVVNIVGMVADAAGDDASIAWVRAAGRALAPHTAGTYVNFLAADESDRVSAAYDQATWARLREIKRQWDPNNVFRINHNSSPPPTPTARTTVTQGAAEGQRRACKREAAVRRATPDGAAGAALPRRTSAP